MNVELELAYLGVEVADPTVRHVPRRRRRPRPRRHHDRRRPTWRNDDRAQRIIVQEAGQRRHLHRLRGRVRRRARPGCRPPARDGRR